VIKGSESYHSFLLRLWRTGTDGTWKASLLDPVTGQRAGFSSVTALFRFLRERLNVTTDAERPDG